MSKSHSPQEEIRTTDDFPYAEPFTYINCTKIHEGDLIMLRNQPCKVVELHISKTGKHGHAKHHFIGLNIFTQKKCEDIIASKENVRSPIVTKSIATLLHVDEDHYTSLLLSNGTTLNDLRLSDQLYQEINDHLIKNNEIQVTIQSANNIDAIMAVKYI